jgi:energy-coupling factor transporter transmembrane protein EcfT
MKKQDNTQIHKISLITVIATIFFLIISLFSPDIASGFAMIYMISLSLFFLFRLETSEHLRKVLTFTFIILLVFSVFFIVFNKQTEIETADLLYSLQ